MPLPIFKSTAHMKRSRSDDNLGERLVNTRNTKGRGARYSLQKAPRFAGRVLQALLAILIFGAVLRQPGGSGSISAMHPEINVLAALFACLLWIGVALACAWHFWPKFMKKPTRNIVVRELVGDCILLAFNVVLLVLIFAAGSCGSLLLQESCGAWNMQIVVLCITALTLVYSVVWDVVGFRAPADDEGLANLSNRQLRSRQ